MPRTRLLLVPLCVAVASLTASSCVAGTAPGESARPQPTTAAIPATAGQAVEALLSDVVVGGTVPADTLRDRLATAVTDAGAWRAEFVDIWTADVTTVLDQDGAPAVRVHGYGEDDPESDLRLVGNALYELHRWHAGGPRWVVATRSDPHELLRLTQDEVDGMLVLGSPTVLVDGLGPGEATLVERSGGRVTLSVQMDHSSFTEAMGAGPSAVGTVPSTWVIADGLPVLVRSDVGGQAAPEFRFSQWGTAGPVSAPPVRSVETMEQHHVLENRPRLPG